MNGVRFMIAGTPVGKERPRFYNGHAVTPKKTQAYEALVAKMFTAQANGRKWMNGEPLEIFIRAYYPIPKSYTKKRVAAIRSYRELPTKKPDWDNIGKIICDALNGVAYKDDTQIVSATVDKFYAEEMPYVFVSIMPIEPEEAEERRNNGREENVCQDNS